MSLRAASNLHRVVPFDGDCAHGLPRVATLQTLNPVSLSRHFHRHGRGSVPAIDRGTLPLPDGRHKTSHEDKGWFHSGQAGVELAMTAIQRSPNCQPARARTARTGGPLEISSCPRSFRQPACDEARTVCCRQDHAGKQDTFDLRHPGERPAGPRSPSRRSQLRPCARRRLVPGQPS